MDGWLRTGSARRPFGSSCQRWSRRGGAPPSARAGRATDPGPPPGCTRPYRSPRWSEPSPVFFECRCRCHAACGIRPPPWLSSRDGAPATRSRDSALSGNAALPSSRGLPWVEASAGRCTASADRKGGLWEACRRRQHVSVMCRFLATNSTYRTSSASPIDASTEVPVDIRGVPQMNEARLAILVVTLHFVFSDTVYLQFARFRHSGLPAASQYLSQFVAISVCAS